MGERHVAGTKHLLDRVQDTGANVTVNNADGAQREGGEGRFGCCHEFTPS